MLCSQEDTDLEVWRVLETATWEYCQAVVDTFTVDEYDEIMKNYCMKSIDIVENYYIESMIKEEENEESNKN